MPNPPPRSVMNRVMLVASAIGVIMPPLLVLADGDVRAHLSQLLMVPMFVLIFRRMYASRTISFVDTPEEKAPQNPDQDAAQNPDAGRFDA